MYLLLSKRKYMAPTRYQNLPKVKDAILLMNLKSKKDSKRKINSLNNLNRMLILIIRRNISLEKINNNSKLSINQLVMP